MDPEVKRQWDYCYAQEGVTEDGHITMYALGGFVPEDEEQAKLFFDANETYRPYVAPMGREYRITTKIKLENEIRWILLKKMNNFLDALRAGGCSVKKATKMSGLCRSDAERLRLRVPDFDKLWSEIYNDVTDELEEAGLKRAIEGGEKTIYYQGIEIGTEKVYSDSVLTFMLQGRRPDVYKGRTATEISGPGGEPFALEKMSDEELDKYLKSRLAQCKLEGIL